MTKEEFEELLKLSSETDAASKAYKEASDRDREAAEAWFEARRRYAGKIVRYEGDLYVIERCGVVPLIPIDLDKEG